MAGFFRRLRRPKEGEPEPEERSSVEPDGAEELPVEEAAPSEEFAGVEPETPAAPVPEPAPTEAPIPSASSTPAAPATPSGPPPPLPEADRTAARGSLTPRRTSTRCFLCGTEMDGPWCPTCRIAWVD